MFLLLGIEASDAQWQQLAVTTTGNVFNGGIFFSAGGLWLAPSFLSASYSSLDTGKTWTIHTFPSNFGRIISIRFLDKYNGIIDFTNNIAQITSDGGQTWREVFGGHIDATFLGSINTILFTSPTLFFISHPPFSSSSHIPITAGKGSYSFIITPKGTVFAGHDPIQMSTDFGNTWQPRLGRYDLDSYSMDVGKFCDDSTMYIVNELDRTSPTWCEIYISSDAGNSFTTKFPRSPLGYFTGSIMTSNHAVFCATSTEGILRSTDKGQTWKSIGGPGCAIDVRSIAVVNDNILFVLDSLGNVWRTDNCGGFPIKPPPPPKPQIASIPAQASSCDSGKANASLTHTYCDALTVTEATLQGADASYFTLLPSGLPISLGNGAKVTFNLNFDPKKEVRSFSASIRVKGWYIFEYEDTIRIDTLIPVTATSTAVAPNLSALPRASIFDSVSTCNPPIDTTVTFINQGCDTLLITQGPGLLAPEFTLLPPFILPIKLTPGDSTKIVFRFSPSGTGTFFTRPRFTAEQQGLKQDIDLYLEGSGKLEGGVFSYFPKKFSFESLSICDHDSTSGYVTNIGCDSLGLDATQIFGDKDFKLSANSSQLTVKPKDTITYKVYLNPAQKGLRQGKIIFTSHVNGNTKQDSIAFTATVTDGTRFLASPISALNFGTTTMCEERDTLIHLTNTGCDTLKVFGITGLGSGFGSNAKFPIIIPPNTDTVIDIFTVLDTSGGKLVSTATLGFTSDADTILPPVKIDLLRSYIASVRHDAALYLDNSAKLGENQSIVTYDIKESKSFTGSGIKTINFDLSYNTDLLEFEPSKSSSNISSPNGRNFTLTGSPEIKADANSVLATIAFRVYLTKDSITNIILTPRTDTFNAPCILSTLSVGGSATFNYVFLCGEKSISSFMNGVMPMKIISIRPNPAQDDIDIEINSAIKQDAKIEVRNALGARVYFDSRSLLSGKNTIHLATKALSSGMYLMRVISDGGEVEQSLVISR